MVSCIAIFSFKNVSCYSRVNYYSLARHSFGIFRILLALFLIFTFSGKYCVLSSDMCTNNVESPKRDLPPSGPSKLFEGAQY